MEMTIRLEHGVWRYDTDQVLGKAGATGLVYGGCSEDGATAVAVKQVARVAQLSTNREQQIARNLTGKRFRYVVPILDHGQDANTDSRFLVMARAELSLKDYLAQQPIANRVQEAAAVIYDVASGLMELESLVHRDLKPGNILRHEGVWKVNDFGIAKLAGEGDADQTLAAHFTAMYASPEQWKHQELTSSTDVYSLGCVAFEVLTGSSPYTGDKDAQRKAHCDGEVPEVRSGDVRLDELIHMMLRKPAGSRPSLSRVVDLAQRIINEPRDRERPLDHPDLIAVNERIEAELRAKAAERTSAASVAEKRRIAHRAGVQQLENGILSRLMKEIHDHAPQVVSRRGETILGSCSLQVQRSTVPPPDPFCPLIGPWADVAAAAQISVMQFEPPYTREALLFYAKRDLSDGYRWYEVAFYHADSVNNWLTSFYQGFISNYWHVHDILNTLQIAYAPRPIDDEDLPAFLKRWVRIFAMGAGGLLQPPSEFPLRSEE